MSVETLPEHRLRVLLIDDHTLFRTGLQELLERRGLEVVGAVGSGQEGRALLADLHPHLVLLDLRMPDDDGLRVLEAIRCDQPELPVIMLTTSAHESDLVRCLRAGAQGYLLKDMEPDQLVDLLHEAIAGSTVVAPGMTAVLAKVVQGDAVPEAHASRFSDLTPREMEILQHLAAGQSNKAIARELGITDGTVKLHVRSILKKLGVQSRVEAAILAVEEGIPRGPARLGGSVAVTRD